MDTIFTLGDDSDFNLKVNLDELYEKKKESDLNTLKVYNKILLRIHNKIKYCSRINPMEQHCWYVIPEVIIGIPKYDHSSCTAYIIHKLHENGFLIRYTHPNLLFISWKTWTPSYVREEIRKKTGIQIDGWGNEKHIENNVTTASDPNTSIINSKSKKISLANQNDNYRDINTYKPTGNLIYNKELFKKIQDRSNT
jgi:hypothetical protein